MTHHRPRVIVGLIIALLGLSHCVSAQLVVVNIPNSVKSAANAEAHRKVIDAFAKATVPTLSDPTKVQYGRDLLKQQVLGAPSPTFLSVYAQCVNEEVLRMVSNGKPSVATRLNAAIAVEGIAAQAGNTMLAPCAVKLVNDPSEAVALWGLRAAHSIIPSLLQMPQAAMPDELTSSVAGAVQRFPQSGAIVTEAYEALRLDTSSPAAPRGATDSMIKLVAPHLINVLQFRVGLYAKGVPPQPAADTTLGTEFLQRSRVWNLLAPQQKDRVVEQMVHLVVLAGQQAAAIPLSMDRRMLIRRIDKAAKALWVIANRGKDAEMLAAAKPLHDLDVNVPIPKLLSMTQAVYDAAIKDKKYKVAPPPIAAISAPPVQEPSADEPAGGT